MTRRQAGAAATLRAAADPGGRAISDRGSRPVLEHRAVLDRAAGIGESARRRIAGFGGWSADGDRLLAEHDAVLRPR